VSDYLPPEPLIPLHERRQREQRIQGRLRMLRVSGALLVDSFYMQGQLDEPRWSAVHEFREDRTSLLQARSRGRVREHKLPADARPRKEPAGFSMVSVGIQRALLCEREMTVERFDDLLVLIGETQGTVDPDKARWAARECWLVYTGAVGTERWKDGRPTLT
jgi:hypothetical protein